jgi:hypothetical protein
VEENPYQSPLADLRPAVGVLSGEHRDVRAVAVYQKGILVCILISLLSIFGEIVVRFTMPEPLVIPIELLGFAVGLAGMVFVFLLSTKVFGIVLGILLGILTVVPCLGLLVLLIINGKATSVLRQNGHRVGLLGARLSEFDNR